MVIFYLICLYKAFYNARYTDGLELLFFPHLLNKLSFLALLCTLYQSPSLTLVVRRITRKELNEEQKYMKVSMAKSSELQWDIHIAPKLMCSYEKKVEPPNPLKMVGGGRCYGRWVRAFKCGIKSYSLHSVRKSSEVGCGDTFLKWMIHYQFIHWYTLSLPALVLFLLL